MTSFAPGAAVTRLTPRLVAFLLAVGCLTAAESPVSFSNQILPILEARCLLCHSQDGGQAQLSLADWNGLMKGGATGPAVEPGDPGESLLAQKLSGAKPSMPPIGDPLGAAEVDLIRRWIAEGARDDGAPHDPNEEQPGETQPWWSFRPLAQPPVPAESSGWARNDIDRFIAAKLREKGLQASREADSATLIRRLTYDLHGLPPTPAAVDAFVADRSPGAYQSLVGRLLESPLYGERWGRHWLDVVHYGESHGYEKDKPRRSAWPYRDYVIRSFNQDKPYARFIEEQLAGDYLRPDDPNGLIATGFIAAGPWDYVGHAELREGTKDKKLARLLDRDDMLAQTMSTFTSLTVHCARCHNHKFDPIPQEDYYSLQAVFAGVDRAEQPYDSDSDVYRRRRALWFELRDAEAAAQPFLGAAASLTNDAIKGLDHDAEALRQESRDLLPKVGETDTPQSKERRREISKALKELAGRRSRLARALMDRDGREKLVELESRRDALQAKLKAMPEPLTVYAAASYFKSYGTFTPAWRPRPVYVLNRGSVESPGPRAKPGAVAAVSALEGRFSIAPSAPEGARRAALARWISDRDNPLTWRSIVNRVWHYHFGRGLVDTPNDFGRMGERPTHPELLDWLAVRFRDGGGSIKDLHRLILNSATYRQSSAYQPAKAAIDADNQFLWRMNRLRLDAEAVRDTVLFLSGRLDFTMGGPSAEQFFFVDDHSPVYDYSRFDFASPQARRRSVYRFLVRSVQDPFMESLDCADPSLLVPKRSSTLTAIQALALLNDPLMIQESRHFATRLRSKSGTLADQIDYGFRLAFGRRAGADELRMLTAHAQEHGLENVVRLLLNSNEFLFVD